VQIRELTSDELAEGFALLSSLRLDLTFEQFQTFIGSYFPKDYRPIGVYEQNKLCAYAGISVRENLELGRHMIIDDLVIEDEDERLGKETIEFLADYAKMHQCAYLFLWGTYRGIKLEDLQGFRPKRDGFIKKV